MSRVNYWLMNQKCLIGLTGVCVGEVDLSRWDDNAFFVPSLHALGYNLVAVFSRGAVENQADHWRHYDSHCMRMSFFFGGVTEETFGVFQSSMSDSTTHLNLLHYLSSSCFLFFSSPSLFCLISPFFPLLPPFTFTLNYTPSRLSTLNYSPLMAAKVPTECYASICHSKLSAVNNSQGANKQTETGNGWGK